MKSVRLGCDHRQACVGLFPDRHVQRHFAQKRHTLPLRLVPRAAVAENIGARAALGAKEVVIFSTIPSTGTLTRLNMEIPRRASMRARSCGVDTITAPLSGTCCAMVSCASPVPGGMSTTMISSVPHSTSRSICVSAEITMGPRQIIGVSSSMRKPMDITESP